MSDMLLTGVILADTGYIQRLLIAQYPKDVAAVSTGVEDGAPVVIVHLLTDAAQATRAGITALITTHALEQDPVILAKQAQITAMLTEFENAVRHGETYPAKKLQQIIYLMLTGVPIDAKA